MGGCGLFLGGGALTLGIAVGFYLVHTRVTEEEEWCGLTIDRSCSHSCSLARAVSGSLAPGLPACLPSCLPRLSRGGTIGLLKLSGSFGAPRSLKTGCVLGLVQVRRLLPLARAVLLFVWRGRGGGESGRKGRRCQDGGHASG
jgi:hypothetical protein